MPTARIFQRPKNAMQSGKARTDRWQLEFEPAEAKQPDPLTGWAGSGDTRDQLRLFFPTPRRRSRMRARGASSTVVIPAPEKS